MNKREGKNIVFCYSFDFMFLHEIYLICFSYHFVCFIRYCLRIESRSHLHHYVLAAKTKKGEVLLQRRVTPRIILVRL